LLYTGLRRGDAARLGPGHVSEGVIVMQAEKTGTQLTIPILPELAHAIDATKPETWRLSLRRAGKP